METEAAAPDKLRLGVLASHPIQYQAPIFRALARECHLRVLFAHRQTQQAQADAGFGVAFDWDVDLLAGYTHEFLPNLSARPGTDHFSGCDTPAAAQAIASSGFDAFLVMGWNLKAYWQAVHACRRSGVPVMVRGDSQLATQRNPATRLVKRMVYPWLLRRFDACLYVGQRNRAYLCHYGVPAPRLFFAPHSVDVDAFAHAASSADIAATRAAWGMSPDEAALLFSGKLVQRKRPGDLLAAATQLLAHGRPVRVIWAGDGPERRALEAQAARLGVPATFLGFQNQSALPGLYRAADLLVLPSEGSETWGLVVNEALACGTRCVVSDACGCAPDLVGPGTGAIFETGDPSSLAEAIAGVLRQPRNDDAIAAINTAYSPDATAAGILKAARAIAARSRVRSTSRP